MKKDRTLPASSPGGAVQMPTPMLSLSAGRLRFDRTQWFSESEQAGVKLVLVLSGSISYQLERSAPVRLCGPSVHLRLRDAPHDVLHGMEQGSDLEYVSASLPMSGLASSLGLKPQGLADAMEAGAPGDSGASGACGSLIRDAQASAAQRAVAQQILHCPLQGAARQLYLAGKGLELLALCMPLPGEEDLSGRGRQQLERAAQLLRERLDDPPGLRALAREVGLNVNKLTQGFRQCFGCTVAEWLLAQRMARAYELLASARMDVAQAAALSGYSPSHFSKVFQRHHGVLPSALRRG